MWALPEGSEQGPANHPPIPWWLALAALPVLLVVSQLVGALAQGIALAAVKRDGAAVAADHPVPVLAAMASGSLLLCAFALAIPLLLERSPIEAYRLRLAPWPVFAAVAVGTFSLGPLADVLMVAMAEHFPDATLGALPRLHDLARAKAFLLLWPFFAVLPGLSEELFFRGFVQSAFARPWLAIAVSALSFALFHLDPHHVVGVFPLGLFLAWAAQRYGVLVTAIAHITNNTVALATLQVAELDVGYGSDVAMPGSWVAVGLALATACVAILTRFPASRP